MYSTLHYIKCIHVYDALEISETSLRGGQEDTIILILHMRNLIPTEVLTLVNGNSHLLIFS